MNRIGNMKYKKRRSTRSKKKRLKYKNLTAKRKDSNPKKKNKEKTEVQQQKKESASERKMKTFSDNWQEEVNENSEFDYILLHKDQLPYFLAGSICTACHSTSISSKFSSLLGFAAKICIQCNDCEEIISEFYTSPRIDGNARKPFHVNRKIIESILMMGLGYAGLQRFCSKMNMSIINKKPFQKIMDDLSEDFLKMKDQVL